MKNYPEVYSLEESLEILKKYKNKISKDDYDNIKSVISSHAIENQYLNETDIEMLIDKAINNRTTEESINRLKNKGLL
ncbi:hypothetical protein [Campylobacter fetus]|uniref:hypothetical protein n=1 Tax=Campylobacter fetus TaxID=196 RepID=UPI00054D826A|nr:hypothetical protein [Campylobacter fetus]OCS38166.1 hypothetical protein AWR30_08640 [Campylobacter fetus subsp. venerealis]